VLCKPTHTIVKMVAISKFTTVGAAALVASSCLVQATEDVHALGQQRAFLGKSGQLSRSAGIADMLGELEKVGGRDQRLATEGRVGRLEAALKPMFAAMPKDEQGHLDAAGVRYLLHRLFVQRHGWFVNGLDNGGGSWNSSSPAAVFEEHASDHHNLFNEKLDKHGFSLHQVAVFAATLETLVHTESMERLESAYRLLDLKKDSAASEEQAAEAIRAYMILYVSGANISDISTPEYEALYNDILEIYPTWPETKTFVEGVRARILEDVLPTEQTTWTTGLSVVEEVAERYGRWQAKECHDLKQMLKKIEVGNTGRVRLQDFYGGSLDSTSEAGWQFSESVPYLRELGALDETDAARPTVIIPNYLNSPANCVASSKFYSVCCIDECEDLVGHLEKQLMKPEATPEEIIRVVSALSSDTVEAPRQLPEALVQRLSEVASHHGGVVPLHGRLFAQWMHHAYPRECQFPHLSGTTNPLTQEAWLERSDEPVLAGEEDIRQLLEKAKTEEVSEVEMPWSAQEELFTQHGQRVFESRSSGSKTTGRGFFLMTVPLSFVVLVAKMYGPPVKGKGAVPAEFKESKYYV